MSQTGGLAEMDAREAFCAQLARSAGKIALAGYARRAGAGIAMKGRQDFLTESDAAVERHIRDALAANFPDDGFLGEETGRAGSDSAVWVVDPIDGTANFARQIPHFCVSIAFVAGGRVALGAIFNPVLDELYLARRGRGATRNGAPIRVADTSDYGSACLELGWSTRVPDADYVRALSNLLEQGANVRRAASGALGLAYVADGRSDGYAELHMQPWDCLAGLLLVEEAGGVVAPFLELDGLGRGGAVLAAGRGVAAAMSAATGIALSLDASAPARPAMAAGE
jgi:myo-inositol-1(or 4)-monophosphatase